MLYVIKTSNYIAITITRVLSFRCIAEHCSQVYNIIIRIVLLLRFVIAAMPLSVSRHSFHPRRHAFGGQCLLGWLCVYIRCLPGIRRYQTRYRRAAFSWCTLYDAREQSKRIYILRDRMRSSHA